ncbi:exported hypothetical protein [Vibrio chagasii]|nr:exported hypothetical protein [Vibrio chagasii]
MKRVIVTLSIAALLSGCQATQRQNATTGETETNSATKGALVGMLELRQVTVLTRCAVLLLVVL